MTAAATAGLVGLRILVVEDEYFIADEIARALIDAGAEVIGPVPTVTEAQLLATDEARIDGALLDMNLGGSMVWPVLDTLLNRGIAVVLTTGYDAGSIPTRYTHLPRCAKPATPQALTRALLRSISS